jgi:RNA polymerase sigma factor (sigma-70 family)
MASAGSTGPAKNPDEIGTGRPVGAKYIAGADGESGGFSMQGTSSRGVWQQLDGLFRFGAAGQLSDEELLGRFVARRDEAAEAAFAALVERHGPMVLGVCRRVLGDRHEAEDAFQATFLVLTRKASAIAGRGQLANWLFGVACRTALGARTRGTRRKAREQRAQAISGSSVTPAGDDEVARCELRSILDEELARLPERYRGAVVLCELEGLSRRTAARRLGISEGTLASRLARAKDELRLRLARRGLALTAIALDGGLAREAEARTLIISFSLVDSTIQAAMRIAAGASVAEVASTSVASLTQGVLKAMLLAKSKGVILGLATAAVITTGFGVVAQQPPSPDGDRLSVLERKLDRILEALGGSRQAETRVIRDHPGFPPAKPGPPGGEEAPSADLAKTPATGHNRFESRKDWFSAETKAPVKPAPRDADTAGPTRGSADIFRDNVPLRDGPPAPPGSPGNVAARMDSFDRRLAELERRINELERPKRSDREPLR